MISLIDQATSVTVCVGEKVTIRIEESTVNGFIWSSPMIEGNGLSLDASRSLTIDAPGAKDPYNMEPALNASEYSSQRGLSDSVEYREFVFKTHQTGRHLVSTSLRQAGLEEGIKNFSMIVDVREPNVGGAVVS